MTFHPRVHVAREACFIPILLCLTLNWSHTRKNVSGRLWFTDRMSVNIDSVLFVRQMPFVYCLKGYKFSLMCICFFFCASCVGVFVAGLLRSMLGVDSVVEIYMNMKDAPSLPSALKKLLLMKHEMLPVAVVQSITAVLQVTSREQLYADILLQQDMAGISSNHRLYKLYVTFIFCRTVVTAKYKGITWNI